MTETLFGHTVAQRPATAAGMDRRGTTAGYGDGNILNGSALRWTGIDVAELPPPPDMSRQSHAGERCDRES